MLASGRPEFGETPEDLARSELQASAVAKQCLGATGGPTPPDEISTFREAVFEPPLILWMLLWRRRSREAGPPRARFSPLLGCLNTARQATRVGLVLPYSDARAGLLVGTGAALPEHVVTEGQLAETCAMCMGDDTPSQEP